MLVIRVFGTGCPKCDQAYENVKKAVEELNIEAEIIKVSDINEIAEWVFFTPGIAFDDLLVFEGETPSVEEIKEELLEYLKEKEG
ncbi:MAG: thioredoxin family protein [Methanococci archaeon]|uniref:Thioredoxin n=1 Tax=Methanocaldococcus vulcanius (strain ATCC 700851 / DSM 12094 / M7) TaxID=579137 RepID=C9RH69_METVM|nr:MTH895/ArsE family thioredoxin-like protein [Methanocaldococcus vulcanius]ACX72921.1 redox-active disulfide protein 2 [Methanocaldococcus vulcanius M7]NPA62708.1 thioredoxin family protein [Methanococci archaeon]